VGRVVSGIIGTKKVGSTAVSLRDARLFSTKLLTSSLPFCDRFPLQHNFVMLCLTILYTQILEFIIIFPGFFSIIWSYLGVSPHGTNMDKAFLRPRQKMMSTSELAEYFKGWTEKSLGFAERLLIPKMGVS
jgi:hypothetical protein